MTALLARDAVLTEIFRSQAVQTKREIKFYQDSERTLEQRDIAEQREKEEHARIEQMEEASREQLSTFRKRLDTYDTAVVEALMDNEHALDQARKRREEIEQGAVRLPDGRRVFRSEDGRRVLDQDGKDVPSTVISPEAIPNKLPRAEAHRDALNEQRRLEVEREQLLQFQGKLDHARDTIDKGGVTKKELDALGDDLEKSMPAAVGRKVGRDNAGPDRDGPKPGATQQDTPSGPVAETRRRPEAFAMSPR